MVRTTKFVIFILQPNLWGFIRKKFSDVNKKKLWLFLAIFVMFSVQAYQCLKIGFSSIYQQNHIRNFLFYKLMIENSAKVLNLTYHMICPKLLPKSLSANSPMILRFLFQTYLEFLCQLRPPC